MTSRERVLATFENKPVDKIPIHHIGFTSYAASLVLGREAYVGGAVQQWRAMNALWNGPDAHKEYLERSRKDAIDVALAFDHDLLRLSYWGWSIKPTNKIDDYTFLFGDPEKSWYLMTFDPEIELFHRTDGYGTSGQKPPKKEELVQEADSIKRLEERIEKEEAELDNYHPAESPDPGLQATLAQYKDYAIRFSGGTASIPHDQFWLGLTALRPDLVARQVSVQSEKVARTMPRLAASGVKLVFAGSDFASNEGPMYSPKAFHDIILPGMKKITEACHKHGMHYLFASDGNLWPVADDLFGNSGVDGFYEIDRRAGMDLKKLRERFPHLTLLGNISSHNVHLGTKEQVVEEVLSCIEVAKEYGKIIVGASNYLMPSTPPENIWAMIETLRKYR